MALTRWDPFTTLARLDEDFDQLVRRAWGTPREGSNSSLNSSTLRSRSARRMPLMWPRTESSSRDT